MNARPQKCNWKAQSPDYAPPIEHVVTMYDLLYDLGLRESAFDPSIFDPVTKTFQPDFKPSFTRDVYPILRRAFDYRWVVPKNKLIIDSDVASITGVGSGPTRLQGTFQATHTSTVGIPLGDLRTDNGNGWHLDRARFDAMLALAAE